MNRVVLVGAGCGEGMMTLKGAELIRRADCIVYDALLDEGVLALAPPRCEKICVGKRAGAHSMAQEEINDLLVACGEKYPLTVRLKGGDPFVFGRGGEELAALAEAGIACAVVPGVTSAVAAAELALPCSLHALPQAGEDGTLSSAPCSTWNTRAPAPRPQNV